MSMFMHIFCLCPLSLTITLNFNISKVAYYKTLRTILAMKTNHKLQIGHYRNVRGLGKSMVIFCLFEKIRYSNERSTIF